MIGMLLRWVFAFLLLAASYNPTQWNYLRWAGANYETQLPMTVLAGLLLLVCYVIYLRATLRSIGVIGMALVLAIAAAALWVLYDYDWLTFGDSAVNTWLAILVLSAVLGIGLGWSHVRRALSGQADMDDVDE